MSQEMRHHINTFKKFSLNENKKKLPTPKMIRWYEDNTSHMEDWDELDRDSEMDKLRDEFFDTFEDELEGHNVYDVWDDLH